MVERTRQHAMESPEFAANRRTSPCPSDPEASADGKGNWNVFQPAREPDRSDGGAGLHLDELCGGRGRRRRAALGRDRFDLRSGASDWARTKSRRSTIGSTARSFCRPEDGSAAAQRRGRASRAASGRSIRRSNARRSQRKRRRRKSRVGGRQAPLHPPVSQRARDDPGGRPTGRPAPRARTERRRLPRCSGT